MQKALKSMFAVAEGYPQLQSSQNFLQLQSELVDTEDKIQAARRFYNGGVRELNTKIRVFPNSTFAKSRGFTEATSSRRPSRRPSPSRRASSSDHSVGSDVYSAIARNKRNTVFIVLVFLVIIGALGFLGGYLAGNVSIGFIVLVVALGYAVLQYFLAARQATAIAGGVEIDRVSEPRLWRTVENLAITMGMPMPRVYVIADPAPNAFATGRDPEHAVVAATTGLLELMDDQELQGVMAHELGHVRNYDIRVSTMVFGLVVAVGFIADILLRMSFFSGLSGGRNRNSRQRRRRATRCCSSPGSSP